jgi:hypothetical protein
MIHDRLTDYQIASAFSDTLSLIYKDKLEELLDNVNPILSHRVFLQTPKYSDFDRFFAELTIPTSFHRDMKAIDHINKIRDLHKKMKKNPESEVLNIEKAKAVPIESLYPFRYKGKNVFCPFHDNTNTPAISLKGNRYLCFSCGAKGSVIDFFMAINKTTFKEAVIKLGSL